MYLVLRAGERTEQVPAFQRKSVTPYGCVLLRAAADERRVARQTGSVSPTHDKAAPRFAFTTFPAPYGSMYVAGTAAADHRSVADLEVARHDGVYVPPVVTAKKTDSGTTRTMSSGEVP